MPSFFAILNRYEAIKEEKNHAHRIYLSFSLSLSNGRKTHRVTLIIRDAWTKRKIFSIIIVQMTHYFSTDIHIEMSNQCVFLHQFIIL